MASHTSAHHGFEAVAVKEGLELAFCHACQNGSTEGIVLRHGQRCRFTCRFLPQPPPKEPTHFKPFKLATDIRGQQHQTELQQKLEAEARAAAAAAHVVAKPLPHSIDVPAVPPKPEPKMLTIPDPFNLKSEVSFGLVKLWLFPRSSPGDIKLHRSRPMPIL